MKDHLGSTRATVDQTGAVVGYDDYDPWGYALAGRTQATQWSSSQSVAENKFTGKERDDDFGINWDYFGARYYDAQIGRFFSLDRFAFKYPSFTPYQYSANNPILFVDVNGDSLAVFDRNTGNFLHFEDDGKKEWIGVTRLIDNKGNATNTSTFAFNDPSVDIQAIRNGAITKVEFVSDETVKAQMEKSGVDSNSGLAYAWMNSQKSGKMDYAVRGALRGDLSKGSFYVREGNAYNLADFGNYLWGRGMSMLNIDLGTTLLGAQYNNFVNGYLKGNDATDFFDFGPGTYGKPGIFDSSADQRAITKGFLNHNKSFLAPEKSTLIP